MAANPALLRGCVVSWDQRFAEPIVLPNGVKLASLREAISELVGVPRAFGVGHPWTFTTTIRIRSISA
jgi:hypothetical protein